MVSNFPALAALMKLVTHLTSTERIYYKLSEQQERLNLGAPLIESESSLALCPNKISVPFSLSLFDLCPPLFSMLLLCFTLMSSLFLQLKVDTYRIYIEVQRLICSEVSSNLGEVNIDIYTRGDLNDLMTSFSSWKPKEVYKNNDDAL